MKDGTTRRLGNATKLSDGVTVRIYPDALEATAVTLSSRTSRSTPGVPDVLHNIRSAARRARTQVRRYIVSNGLTTAATLSFSKHSQATDLWDAHHAFMECLRSERFDGRFPWLAVAEGLCDHTRPHLHLALPPVEPGLLDRLWPHGRVHASYMSDVNEMRRWAEYLSKQFDNAGRPRGQRRYRTACGFTPEPLVLSAQSLEEADRIAVRIIGRQPQRTVSNPMSHWQCWNEDTATEEEAER